MRPRTLCPIVIGRDAELSDLEDAVLAARRGEGQIVLIAGEAGLGKSRLLAELRAQAEAGGLQFLAGSCSEAEVKLPYLPVLQAIRTQMRSGSGTPDPDLELLFGRGLDDQLDAEARRVRLYEAVARCLESSGPAGTVLAVEDLHWSDSGTRDLLDYLSRVLAGSRVLIAGTYRTDEVDRRHPLLPLVRAWVQRGSAALIELKPLAEDEIGAFLGATIGTQDLAVARRLHARSEGNPFVLEEILKTEGAAPAATGVPPTVRETILRRADALPPAHLNVLRAAAVLGDSVDDAVLEALLGDVVPEALEACAREQLLTVRPDGRYAWRHAITREAVYEELGPARRRRLHSELADICEGRAGHDDVAICRHLAAAGRWEEAVPRARSAAAVATALGAFDDAARLLLLCLDHIPDPAERAGQLEELALLLVQAGRPEDGEHHARAAESLWAELGGGLAAAQARRTLAVCLWQQARWDEAMAVEDRTIAELELLPPQPLLAEALARRAAWGAIARDEVSAGLDRIGAARRIAAQLGYESAVLRGNEGQVLAIAGRLDEGFTILDDCWRELLRNPRGSAAWREGKFLLHHAVALRTLIGRFQESLALLAERPARGQDAADLSLDTVEAEALWSCGEVERARARIAEVDLARVERSVIPWAQVGRAAVLASAGELDAAAALARRAMPPHWQATSQLRAAELVRILALAGDRAAATEFESRLAVMRGFPAALRLPVVDALVEAHLASGRLDAADALLPHAQAAPADDPMRLRIEGRLALARRDAGRALSSLDGSAHGFAASGWRQEEWRSRRLRAGALRSMGDAAAADLELQAVERECLAGGEVLQARLAARDLGREEERPPTGPVSQKRQIGLTLSAAADGAEGALYRAWAERELERRGGLAERRPAGAALRWLFDDPEAARRAAAALRDKAARRGVAVDVVLDIPEATGLALRLSAREREIAQLVAGGLRNREIAQRLYISERTVENHVHRVLERTGLRSRAELAAWVARLSGELSVFPE